MWRWALPAGSNFARATRTDAYAVAREREQLQAMTEALAEERASIDAARAEAARDSRTDVGRDLALDGAEGSNIVFTFVVPRLFPVIKMQQQMQF